VEYTSESEVMGVQTQKYLGSFNTAFVTNTNFNTRALASDSDTEL